MIDSGIDGLCLEPGKMRGQLGHAVRKLCVLLNLRNDHLRIQAGRA
jgi:hypothetical protein